MTAAPPDAEALRRSRARIERLSYWLDDFLRIPGLGWKVGVESIVGLIPVVGDVAGFALGLAVIVEALRVNAPTPLVLRMLLNSGLDAAVGLVPVAGDLLDFAYKSNRRNLRLLSGHLDTLEGRPARRSWPRLLLGVMLIVALAAAVVAGAIWVWSLF